MSATLVPFIQSERCLLTTSVGPTVVTNAPLTYGALFTLTAGTYTFTVTRDGNTVCSQSGIVIADLTAYYLPRIDVHDGVTNSGTVKVVGT